MIRRRLDTDKHTPMSLPSSTRARLTGLSTAGDTFRWASPNLKPSDSSADSESSPSSASLSSMRPAWKPAASYARRQFDWAAAICACTAAWAFQTLAPLIVPLQLGHGQGPFFDGMENDVMVDRDGGKIV